MTAFTNAFRALKHGDELTPEESLEVDDVLDAAVEFCAGRMGISAFAAIGTLHWPGNDAPSPAHTRYVAMAFTPNTDPRKDDLRRAIDKLLVHQGYHLTKHGLFTSEELASADTTIKRRNHP